MRIQPILEVRFEEFQTWETPLILHTTQNKDISNFNKFDILKNIMTNILKSLKLYTTIEWTSLYR